MAVGFQRSHLTLRWTRVLRLSSVCFSCPNRSSRAALIEHNGRLVPAVARPGKQAAASGWVGEEESSFPPKATNNWMDASTMAPYSIRRVVGLDLPICSCTYKYTYCTGGVCYCTHVLVDDPSTFLARLAAWIGGGGCRWGSRRIGIFFFTDWLLGEEVIVTPGSGISLDVSSPSFSLSFSATPVSRVTRTVCLQMGLWFCAHRSLSFCVGFRPTRNHTTVLDVARSLRFRPHVCGFLKGTCRAAKFWIQKRKAA